MRDVSAVTRRSGEPGPPEELARSRFRDAMARYPTGVAIITTGDDYGVPHGFTANSLCSVSMEPPLVLFCLASSANSYSAFQACSSFAVNVLAEGHAELARRFARKGGDKFADSPFVRVAGGLRVLEDAVSVVECQVYDRRDVGDHLMVIGLVRRVRVGSADPVIYVDRAFRSVAHR